MSKHQVHDEESREGAAVLLLLLEGLQRFDTISHPTASVACYLVA
jgi:hypothetical protein